MAEPPTALLTDHYELTMLQACLCDGTAERPAVFEVFTRHLPEGRRYGVLAGTGRLLDALARFRFGSAELDFLAAAGIVDERTCQWLSEYRFAGDIDGYAEGELYFPDSPVLTVTAPFGQAVLLETIVLSTLNYDSAVASAAARMVGAAGDRPCIEMGSRRAHEQSAVAVARAAHIAGFAATSNLEAGRRWGIPTTGTSAHAFTLVHDDEPAAFASQVAALGADTTLLVDTFDTLDGIRRAVAAAGPRLGAVRLDSGDLGALAHQARALLDELGATTTRIVVTGDLDEHAIAALAAAPADSYGVGTSVVTGSGAPTAGFVYKLVARGTDAGGALVPVAKESVGKAGTGGRKWAVRRCNTNGTAVAEVVGTGSPRPQHLDRPLQTPLVQAGRVVRPDSVWQARQQHARSIAELPLAGRQLSRGQPALPTVFAPAEEA